MGQRDHGSAVRAQNEECLPLDVVVGLVVALTSDKDEEDFVHGSLVRAHGARRSGQQGQDDGMLDD